MVSATPLQRVSTPVRLGMTVDGDPAVRETPRRGSTLRARPIPVAAYPAGVPRWVTYDGRRHRVVAVHDQPALDLRLDPVPRDARRVQVELADGCTLTLLHRHGGWYEGR